MFNFTYCDISFISLHHTHSLAYVFLEATLSARSCSSVWCISWIMLFLCLFFWFSPCLIFILSLIIFVFVLACYLWFCARTRTNLVIFFLLTFWQSFSFMSLFWLGILVLKFVIALFILSKYFIAQKIVQNITKYLGVWFFSLSEKTGISNACFVSCFQFTVSRRSWQSTRKTEIFFITFQELSQNLQ